MAKSRTQRKREKRTKRLARESRQQSVNNRRGSALWAFNHFRSRILTSLLNDLYDLEGTGMQDEYCKRITTALNYFGNAATDVPSAGPMLGPIYKDIEKFTKLYEEWNNIYGNGEEQALQRRDLYEKLRKQRQTITDKARKLQVAIQENLDSKIMDSGYRAIGGLITLVPDLLGNLTKAFGEYAKRGGAA